MFPCPKPCEYLILHGKSNFADMIKRWGHCPELSRQTYIIKRVHIKESQEGHREGSVITKAEGKKTFDANRAQSELRNVGSL